MSPEGEGRGNTVLDVATVFAKIAVIVRQIQRGIDLNQILPTAIATVRSALQTDRVILARVLPPDKMAVIAESVGTSWKAMLDQRLDSTYFQTQLIEAAPPGTILNIADVHQTARADRSVVAACREQFSQWQIQASLAVAIWHQDELWGWLMVHHCRCPRQWEILEIEYVQQVALHLELAIQQAALHRHQQELERQLTQAQPHPPAPPAPPPLASPRPPLLTPHPVAPLDAAPSRWHWDESQYRHLIENMQAGFVVHGTDTQILRCNAHACQLLGLSPDQMFGKTAIEPSWHFLRDDGTVMPIAEYPVNLVLATQAPLNNYVVGINRVNQCRAWVLVTAFPKFDDQGQLVQVVVTFVDITKQKQAELTLAQELLLSKTLFNTSIDGIVLLNSQGDVLQTSASFANMLGYTIAETYNLNLVDWDAQWDQATLLDILAGHIPLPPRFETQHRRKDGSIYDVEISYSREQINGETIHFCICRDISDRKQAERQLQDLSNRLDLALRSAQIGTWDWDIEHDRLIWDDRMYALYGITPDTFEGAYHAWQAGVHPDDRAASNQAVQQILAGKANFGMEFRIVWPDGSIRHIEAHALVERDEHGHPLHLIGINIDISDRKTTEVALRESEARYRSVITAMAEGVVLQTADGTIIACNASATQILGLTIEQMQGKKSIDFDWQTIHEDGTPFPSEQHPAMLTLQTGQPQTNVIMGIHKNHATTWISINSQPLIRPGESRPHAVVASFADITSLKQAELTLKWQAEQQFLLMNIAQRIRQTLDLGQILDTTVTEVRRFLQVDRVVIFRFNPDHSGVVLAESIAAGWRSLLGMTVTEPWFLANHTTFYQHSQVTANDQIDTANLTPSHKDWLRKIEVQANLVMPIVLDHEPWGLLIAHQCRSPRAWQPLEIELQQQLATQLAIAIQQANLYQQVQTLNLNLETQVQERTAQLQQALHFAALLKVITEQVRDSLDEAVIFQRVVEELAIALEVNCCDITRYNADQTVATLVCEFSQNGFAASDLSFNLSDGAAPELYEYLLRGESCQFCLLYPNVIRPEQPPQAILASPIRDDQGVLGDLWLFRAASDSFSPAEIRLVQQVVDQCAIALRQARLYQSAQAQVQALERLNQLKDDFLSTVSHELRTPMANIQMATQMIEISLQQMGALDAAQDLPIQRYFNVLHTEEQRELRLINDLLDLARLDAGTEILNFTTIELQFYLPHLTEPFSERANQQQQQFVFHIPEHLPAITTDLRYLERILTELCQNACKYTPPGGTITVSAQAVAHEALEICVSNSGVEILPDECDRVFDKFYRIPNNDPWKHGGTGLGLALVKKLVEELGGSILASSASGLTCFTVTLPQSPLANRGAAE